MPVEAVGSPRVSRCPDRRPTRRSPTFTVQSKLPRRSAKLPVSLKGGTARLTSRKVLPRGVTERVPYMGYQRRGGVVAARQRSPIER